VDATLQLTSALGVAIIMAKKIIIYTYLFAVFQE
jgi:hypothetical protein